MRITAEHSIPGIAARVTQCKITDVNDDGTPGQREVFPIHSFDPFGDTCYDQRLNVQDGSDPMTWTYRAFRTDSTAHPSYCQ